jgi:hypothetical protein
MPITPFKRVVSRGIYGADVSGLQDAVNKMETVLNMQTASAVNHLLQAVADQSDQSMHRLIYEGSIRNWLENPVPVIKRNGINVTPDQYALYAAQGMVIFHQPQSANAVITADFTHITAAAPLSGHAGAGNSAHSAASASVAGFMSASDKSNLDGHINAGGAVHPNAAPSVAGFMSASDKSRLDALDFLRYRRSGFYHCGINATAFAAATTASGAIDVLPFYVPVNQTFNRIAINVTTVATGECRLGIYADNGSVYPGSLVLDAGTVSTGGSTGIRELTVSLNLAPNLYWLARLQNAAPSLQGLGVGSLIALGTTDLVNIITGFRATQAFGVLPNTYPAGASNLSGARPAVFLWRA